MADVCVHLLTKADINRVEDPLGKIWELENWLNSLDRVLDIEIQFNDERRQHFILTFDAGRNRPDRVEVERIRDSAAIHVTHLTPPPGIQRLSALWWLDKNVPSTLFARRTMLIEKRDYSPDKARFMFGLLKENLSRLIGQMP